MKPIERLFSAASAHGIDLKQAAGESANLYGAGAPRRRRLMERLAGIALETAEERERRERHENRERIAESVTGKQTRVVRPRLYSHAELGQSLAGLEGPPYLAAMYSFALDGEVYSDLYRALRKAMAELAEREKWPIEIEALGRQRVHYGDELCRLTLVADWCQPFFVRVPALYAIFLGVPEEVWVGQLMRLYLETAACYQRWLAIARGYVNRRVREEFERLGEAAPAGPAPRDPTNPAARAAIRAAIGGAEDLPLPRARLTG